jgi:ribose/xylose/arabinose/galactoside ABC-type transport system permease subunit
MIFCTQCGKEMNDDALFCTGCGHKLVSEPQLEETQYGQTISASQSEEALYGQAVTSFTDDTSNEPLTEMSPLTAPESAYSQPVASGFVEGAMAAPPLPYRGVFPEAEPIEAPSYKIKSKRNAPLHTKDKTHPSTFLNTGMGLILVLLLLCTAVFLSVITPLFFEYNNLMSVIKQCALFSLLAIAATLTTRAGGLDLSIGPCIAMSAVIIAQTMLMGGSAVSGALLAASAALVLGLINGFAVVFFKTPALIVTLASGLVVSGVSTAFTQGQMLETQFSERIQYFASTSIIGILALLGAAFLLGFLYHLLTKIGRPLSKREQPRPMVSYMFAYLASAEIAAAAGFILLVRFQSATSTIDLQYTAFIIFVFALLTASRALDNRFAPVLFALVPGIIWGLLSNVFKLWGVLSFYQPIVYSVLALICLMFALLSRFEGKKV